MGNEIFWAVVRLVIFLPLIIGLMYVLMRYGLSRRLLPVSTGRYIKVIEQVPLGPKAALSVVKVGRRCYLCGHGEGVIALLREIDDDLPEGDTEPAVPAFEKVVASKIRQMFQRH
ncbi:MAG: flagellar biosynthetic protein FliO [Bacillota bacterium]